jgi:hypothetical protein
MRRRGFGAVLTVALLLTIGRGSSRAQTLPPLPGPVEGVLALVSPTVSPVCGDATLVTVLLPALLALPIAIPPQVEQALSPVAIACGAVPAPNGAYTCGLDAQAQAIVDSITYQAAGTTSPVAITPGAIATEQVVTIEDALPPQVKEFNLGKTVAGTFQCTPTVATAEPKPKPPAGSAALPPPVAPTASSPPPALLPSVSPSLPAPSTPSASSVPSAPSASAPPTSTSSPTAVAIQPVGYHRAGLPVGPLVALLIITALLGVGLALAVTRPILARSTKEGS